MLLTLIVACEVGFWAFLLLGLAVRYVLRWQRVGVALLICVPIVDLVLLGATALDLRSGSETTFEHGLAAVYLGFTTAFGHRIIHWADQRFAHRFAGGPPPAKPPGHGWAHARYEWSLWLRGMLGAAISCTLIVAAIFFVGEPSRTRELREWLGILAAVMGLWLVAWPLWYTVFPKKSVETPRHET